MQSSTLIRRCIGIESAYISAGTKCAKQPLQAVPLPPMKIASHHIRYRQSSSIHHPSRAIRSIGGCNHNTGSTLYRSHPAASATSHFSRNLLRPGNANENTDIVVANVSSSLFSTTTTDNNTPAANTTKPQYQYIHPLSQIVLEHLQSRHTSWVQKVGLDEGLRLNEDGTFVLRFPGEADADGEGGGEGGDDDDDNDGEESSSAGGTNGSIWTVYEPEEKKHYLCVTKGNLVGRYMLQDNKKPAWHSDRRSTPERVQDAVDEMICKLEETGN